MRKSACYLNGKAFKCMDEQCEYYPGSCSYHCKTTSHGSPYVECTNAAARREAAEEAQRVANEELCRQANKAQTKA